MEFFTNPAFLALVGTLFGTVGLKVIEHWLNRTKQREDSAKSMRDELRNELDRKDKAHTVDIEFYKTRIQSLEKEKDDIEGQLDNWREKYWQLKEQHFQIRAELMAELELLKHKPTN